MKILGIIPARANSKGIINKNRQLLAGKSLSLHAIDTALASGVLDRLIVSSDDDILLKEASSREKVEIPFKRPDFLAQDQTLISEVISHLLDWLWEKEKYQADAFMLIEPTSPLRTAEDLRLASEAFRKSRKATLVSVSAPIQHPSNMILKAQDNLSYCLNRQANAKGRQDFDEVWFINGALYLTKTDYFLAHKKVYDLNDCELYKMPPERAFDINTEWDLALLRAYYEVSHFTQEGKEKYA